ncbi:MAG: hypothetical protein FJZ01_25790 [Candidatus Sericytochromatia bacterium]|nr:hypothetical protein [Candidatus Tanganyikabacteria bacterium]
MQICLQAATTGGLAVYDEESMVRAARLHEDLRFIERLATDPELTLAIRQVRSHVGAAINEYLTACAAEPGSPEAIAAGWDD